MNWNWKFRAVWMLCLGVNDMSREMKDSGVEWIGEIPEDWKVEKLQWHLQEINKPNNPVKTEYILSLNNKTGVIPYEERAAIVAALRYVDEVVPQEDKNKLGAWEKYHFDKMFVGSDWKGTPQWEKYERQLRPHGVEIVYLSHTDGISSTKLTGVIKGILDEHPEVGGVSNLILLHSNHYAIEYERLVA